jgi:large subunit ribosomal protein L5
MSTPLLINTNDYFQKVNKEAREAISEKLNVFEYPALDHITINVGVGSKYENKKKTDVAEHLTKLTAQKTQMIATKKSISGFNLRAGHVVGAKVTLRGKKMYDFLLNLIYTALPRNRDFKGVKKSFDKSGKTFSLGISSVHIFPTIGFDADLDFGMQVNLVFKNNSKYNELLLQKFNFPFTK